FPLVFGGVRAGAGALADLLSQRCRLPAGGVAAGPIADSSPGLHQNPAMDVNMVGMARWAAALRISPGRLRARDRGARMPSTSPFWIWASLACASSSLRTACATSTRPRALAASWYSFIAALE